jgi:ABC-2 type transport system permease protein
VSDHTDPLSRIAIVEDGPATWQVLRAVLWRDVYVTRSQLPVFLAEVALQPVFLLFIFGNILIGLGLVRPEYVEVLFPGLVALTAVLTGLQATAHPLVIDFGWTKEIEDRLMAPVPVGMIAIEKVIFAAMRGLAAAVVMFPIGVWTLGSIPWRASGVPLLVAILVLGSLLGASLGLIIGTVAPPTWVNIISTLVLTPLLFTGASQYPWSSLGNLRWFQVISACNPLTYVSEGLRAALAPQVPHIEAWISVSVLIMTVASFIVLGVLSFRRRAIN